MVPFDHPRAALARAERGHNGDFTAVNYATFWVNGHPTTCQSDQFHSEKECWLVVGTNNDELQGIQVGTWPTGDFGGNQTADQVLGATGVSIDPVYTERQPCGECAPFLNEILPANANVYYSAVYPSKETKKFSHWDLDPDQFAWNALLSMNSGREYKEEAKKSQKDGRKVGNKELKGELKKS